MKKKLVSIFLTIILIIIPVFSYGEIDITSKSALLMDYNTGKVIYSLNENEKLPPYKEVPLKWNYETLVGDNQVVDEHIKEFIPSKKQVLKYLLERDIILTPKQYKKLWKKS